MRREHQVNEILGHANVEADDLGAGVVGDVDDLAGWDGGQARLVVEALAVAPKEIGGGWRMGIWGCDPGGGFGFHGERDADADREAGARREHGLRRFG
jgi:hypothetical protein